jgi:hypothetical protein
MEAWLLYNVPTALLCLAIVVTAVALSLGGLVLVRRSVTLSTLESHHEVAGFILAVVGVVYAVLLAFVVIVTWEQYEEARADADREAALVEGLHRTAGAFPTGGPQLQTAVRGYMQSVVEQEWPEMEEHQKESRDTDEALDKVWKTLEAARPQGRKQTEFYDQAVTDLVDTSDLRRMRVLTSETHLPVPVWVVLIAGGLISVGFTYFFGVRSFVAQALMIGAFAAITGLVLFLILSLDLPYTGDVAVGPDAMEEVLEEARHFVA